MSARRAAALYRLEMEREVLRRAGVEPGPVGRGLCDRPGNPAEEIALFQLCRSKMEAGYRADALEALTKLKDRFPESGYIARCEDHIRTIQGER